MKSSAKQKRGGGRPIGPLTKKIKHFDRPSSSKRIETDADQLRIKLAIDTKHAGAPDMGRVIPKGTPEFERIASELLARENKCSGVDMAVKFCTVPGCKKMAQWGKNGMCTAHHSAAKAAAFVAAVDEPAVVAVAEGCKECGVTPCACFEDAAAVVDIAPVSEPAAPPVAVDPVLLLALREAWATKESEWLADLAGMKPGKAVCCGAGMVRAVEGLGY